MNGEIGIGIIDVYTQQDLDTCYNSIPKITDNIIVVSDTKNNLPDCETKRYGNGVPFATLRNWVVSQFRLKGNIEHIFLITSNQIVEDFNIFEKTIKTSKIFGPQLILGPEVRTKTIEDDDNKIDLNLSDKLNVDFVYISNQAASKIGYFDDRFLATKNLDVLDYAERLRKEKMYTPTGYNPIIVANIKPVKSKIQKPNFKDIGDKDRSLDLSFGLFFHKYNYIPTQNDPKPVSDDDLVKDLQELQNTYGTN
jgi:hypothetical protein